ncbi:unnamed protein product [Peniophora sp. CBMAI 1063]|nr:unnamed protein product [Peniophora sp. CBMAI 1063]
MANAMAQIVLYDTVGTKMPDKAWSPNVFKIRFALNYKQLPYRTEWVETVDVRATAQRIGAPPTGKKRDGTLIYTVPIIFCTHCNQHVSNSLDIAIHLDRAFPEKPRLFAPGLADEALVRAWDDQWNQLVGPHFFTIGGARTHAQLPPRAAAFFRKTREGIFKMSLEEQTSPERVQASWAALRKGLSRMAKYTPPGETYFAGGDTPTYPDCVMAAYLVWMKRMFGRDSPEWREIESFDQGRWARLMVAFEQWEYTEDNTPAKARL